MNTANAGSSTSLALIRRSIMTTTFSFPRGAFVGFDHIFSDLERMANSHKKDHYPPHNVVHQAGDQYLIELAVVGFKEKDIDISVHEGILTVKGNREQRREQSLYVYKGISGRKFERSFRLSEFVEVTGAFLSDGLLTISLERVVPEEKRPRKIPIGQNEEYLNVTNDNNTQLLTEHV